MKIGKQQLIRSYQLILQSYGLFHFDDHLSHAVGFLYGRKNFGSYLLILLIGKAAAASGTRLHINSMAVLGEFFCPRRS